MASIFSWNRPEVAIDFGTANMRIIRRDEGIVFDEPSLCCFEKTPGEARLVAAGVEALDMVDRTPRPLQIKRPLCRGVLQDIAAATQMLRYALPRAAGIRRLRPARVLIGVPADATQAERGALLTAARDADLRVVGLVSEPLAAALGADLPIDRPRGTMIVECGAGTTEVAVLSLGGICGTQSVRIGGARLAQGVADHLHFRHKMLIGDPTAERIVHAWSSAGDGAEGCPEHIEVRGRSLRTGLPSAIALPIRELDGVAEKHVGQIVGAVRSLLNAMPPELSHDIHAHGIVLTGGGAVTPLLRDVMARDTGLRVNVADDAVHCVSRGLHRLLH